MIMVHLQALWLILPFAFLGWIYSLKKTNVNIVDSMWSLMFLIAASTYLYFNPEPVLKNWIVISLVVIWALRLSIHLTMRNWNHEEDHRYQKIRGNNEPFAWKSFYIVFGLQGFLAWLISIPLLSSLYLPANFIWLDWVALALFTIGFIFESMGDYQLHQFRSNPENKGKVLDTGLWRYTRHPNYFGEFCIWWAFYLFALSSGAWWTIYSPLIMTFLLLKVSGVVMMEQDMTSRRPAYQAYIESTNTFFPGLPRRSTKHDKEEVIS